MFSIIVEESYRLNFRKGITLIGRTSGDVKVGSFLTDKSGPGKLYKIIGIEMLHHIDEAKNATRNPAIVIEGSGENPSDFNGKILEVLDT